MSKKRNRALSVTDRIVLFITVISILAVLYITHPHRLAQEPALPPATDSAGMASQPSTSPTPIQPPVSTPGVSFQPTPTASSTTGSEQEPEPSPEPAPANPASAIPAPANPASDITDELIVTVQDRLYASILLDRDYNTRRVLNANSTITISATEEIHSLYLIWDMPPGEWTISGENPQVCGKNGFIHEYVQLVSPAKELTANLPQKGATLCDIYAFTEGFPPDWVQTWLPPCESADILILPTHADDEHLYFVGILPYYAGEMGYNVQVAYMTNHWNEQPRPHELLNGLWTVGVRNHPVISGFNDQYAGSLQEARSLYGFDTFVNFQVELLRRFKPLVVVGHDLNGEYGHGAHMLNALALKTAVEYAASVEYHPASFKQYGAWDTPKLYLHLYPENAITMDWSVPLERFGGATAYDMAAAGYGCHLSQHRWAFAVPKTGPTGHKFGLVRSLVGPDIIGGDLLENLGKR